MLSQLNFICIFSLLTPSLLFALEGNSSSGGGECIEYEENPWFVGSEPVSYCIQKDPSFSLSEKDASNSIKDALANWVSTIQVLQPRPVSSDLLSGHRPNLTTSFVETPCSDATELTFLLGGKNTLVENTLKAMAKTTIAFAKQISFNEKTGRAKGFIWVTADNDSSHLQKAYNARGDLWSHSHNFYNVILHELGHTFGVLHQSSGIMSADAPSIVVNFLDLPKFSPSFYVSQKWLFLNQDTPLCGTIFYPSGALLPFFQHNDGAFSRVTGCLSQSKDNRNEINLTFWNASLESTGKKFSIKLSGSEDVLSGLAINGRYLENSLARTETHTFISDENKLLNGFVKANENKLAITIETMANKMRIRYFDPLKEISGYFDLMISEIETDTSKL